MKIRIALHAIGLAMLCTVSAAQRPIGFASVAAYGVSATTGGGEVAPVEVRTAAELRSACERLDIKDKKARDNSPRVIVVASDIDLGVLKNGNGGNEIKEIGVIRVRSNTTIEGRSGGSTLSRGTLEVAGACNVIIRNLRFRNLWEHDPTGAYDEFGWDYVRLTSSGTSLTHHVWVDHCDFEKAYDGLLDIVHGSDCVTISNCRFAGDNRGPQKKSMLIGHSSSTSAAQRDRGRLNVTLYRNLFENIEERAPRARFGNIHFLNNVVAGAKCATISVSEAITLVDGSVYENCRIATSFSHANDSVEKKRGGTICIVASTNHGEHAVNSREGSGNKFELENNFKSNVGRDQLKFNATTGLAWPNRNGLPYTYSVEPTEGLRARLREEVGPR